MLNHTALDSQLNELLAAPCWTVGFSGGLDSTVLLHLLHDWCAANPGAPPLSAIHINHSMQVGAADWQNHCAGVCHSLQLSLNACTVVVRAYGSGEAAARAARYRAFEEQMRPDAVLFLGHHLDDQVETFFLRLLRGAGVEGLAAMPRRRPLGKGLLVRPLLDCSREDLEHYAACHSLTYVNDPSNSNTAIDRNFLRHQLLPLIASRWPGYRHTVTRASGHMAAVAGILADHLGVPETVHSAMGDPGLMLAGLLDETVEVSATLLRAWLRERQCLAPDHAVLAEFLRQLREATVAANPRLVCGSFSLQRFRDRVYLLPEFAAMAPAQPLNLTPGEGRTVPGVGTFNLSPAATEGVWLAPGERLTLHWRQGGVRCHLPGRVGSRDLKAVMQECGIPPWWRDRIPLLYVGDELLAVGDVVRCESSRWRSGELEDGQLWNLSWQRHVGAGSD